MELQVPVKIGSPTEILIERYDHSMFVSVAASKMRARFSRFRITEKLLLASFATSLFFCLLLLAALSSTQAQDRLAERMAETVMTRWKDSWEIQPGRTEKWSYDQGVVLKGIEALGLNGADGKHFRFIQQSIDRFVNDDGTIRSYEIDEYTLPSTVAHERPKRMNKLC
jgi:hypothetical protein